jgi:hypothetical protein
MDIKNFLSTFLAVFLSAGSVIGAATYLFRMTFENRLKKEVERFKAELQEKLVFVESKLRIDEAQEATMFRQLLDFRSRQLSDFYWPLYIGLQKDNVIWRRILDKRDAKNELRKRVGAVIERDIILPNHEKLTSLIEKNIHLMEPDKELEELLLVYIRHVAVYRSIRAAGEEMVFPMKAGEEWPHDLFPAVEHRLRALQDEYNRLVRVQRTLLKDITRD